MVNSQLKRGVIGVSPRYGTAKNHGKPEVSSVNESFSKRFKFAENSRRIRFECKQKPEQPLQTRLLACVMRRHDNSRSTASSGGAGRN
jgi:hypothetical protein